MIRCPCDEAVSNGTYKDAYSRFVTIRIVNARHVEQTVRFYTSPQPLNGENKPSRRAMPVKAHDGEWRYEKKPLFLRGG